MKKFILLKGIDIVRGMNTLFNQRIEQPSDVVHFSNSFGEWLWKLQDHLYVYKDREAAKKMLSLNTTNYLGKKTRALLHALDVKAKPKNLDELIDILSEIIEENVRN